VRSFLAARLFGVPLSAYLNMPLDGLVDHWQVAVVTVPLILLAAVATHLTARLSLRQQPADGPLAGVMRWTPWVFPLGVLVGGALFPFPVAILIYWVTNGAWTLVQQWLVLRR
jgi:YidC/Oxa1 family membrane protein insertase